MRPEALKYLYDIRQACGLLDEFIQGRTFEDYVNDALLQSAVERQFMIVGEALFQMLKVDPSFEQTITDVRRIINFRHVMVHGYATIEHRTVWGIVEKELPTLRREVDALLKEADPA